MPKPKPQTTDKKKAAAATGTQQQVPERKVVYPEFSSTICAGDGKAPGCDPALTAVDAKSLLWWEDEPTYAARVLTESGRKGAKLAEHTLIDQHGAKVMCWNNARNRPFDEATALKYAQDILNNHWAPDGPNGEAIIIGRTGLVLSGQHRLIGLVFAEQLREKDQRWQQIHPGPVTMDTFLSFGVSEAPRSVQTLDNVRPRTLADVLFTSDVFRDLRSAYERKECSRMLDAAVAFLWQRTGQGGNELHQFRTHAESQEFLDRHPRLLQCVMAIFRSNQNREISQHRLSPGQCAACMYLQGSAKSDWAKYLNAGASEKVLDWTLWPKAEKFWTEFTAGRFGPLVAVLGAIQDEASGLSAWKQVILAKAWAIYLGGKALTVDDLQPASTLNEETKRRELDEFPGFGGIDQGPRRKAAEDGNGGSEGNEGDRLSVDELKARLEAARAKVAAERGDGKPEQPVATKPAAPAKPMTVKRQTVSTKK